MMLASAEVASPLPSPSSSSHHPGHSRPQPQQQQQMSSKSQSQSLSQNWRSAVVARLAANTNDDGLLEQLDKLVEAHPNAAPLLSRVVTLFQSHSASAAQKQTAATAPSTTGLGPRVATIHDVSVSAPMRKKLDMHLHSCGSIVLQPAGDASQPVLVMHLESLAHVFALPTPGKQKPHTTFVLAPNAAVSLHHKVAPSSKTKGEPKVSPPAGEEAVIFGFDETGAQPKITYQDTKFQGIISKPSPAQQSTAKAATTKKVSELLLSLLRAHMVIHTGASVKFHDSPSSGPPQIKAIACHVKATQEGHIYLLPQALFVGFKKPVVVVPSDRIHRLEVVGLTSRLFSLAVRLLPRDQKPKKPDADEEEEDDDDDDDDPDFVFEHIDRESYDLFSSYAKRIGVPFGLAGQPQQPKTKKSSAATASKDDGETDEDDAEQDEDDDDDADTHAAPITFESDEEDEDYGPDDKDEERDEDVDEEYDSNYNSGSDGENDKEDGEGEADSDDGEDVKEPMSANKKRGISDPDVDEASKKRARANDSDSGDAEVDELD